MCHEDTTAVYGRRRFLVKPHIDSILDMAIGSGGSGIRDKLTGAAMR